MHKNYILMIYNVFINSMLSLFDRVTPFSETTAFQGGPDYARLIFLLDLKI